MENNKFTLSSEEADIIGEIMNISMGSAATAVSTLLNRQVVITTPKVSLKAVENVDYSNLEPAMIVTITYVEGISGSNVVVFRQTDMQMILNVLMGKDEPPTPDFEFDDFAISAACEVMNQMMGSSATALSSFLGKSINISTPTAKVLGSHYSFAEAMGIEHNEQIVCILFDLIIEGVMNSQFISVLSHDLTKLLVGQFIGVTDAAPPPPAPMPEPVVLAPKPVAAPTQSSAAHKPTEPTNLVRQDVNVKKVSVPQFNTKDIVRGTPLTGGNLDLIMNVPLNVSIEIGKAQRKIKDIMSFSKGSVIELEKQAGAPVDIVVNGQLIARGDVVVIDDNFAVRVTEIINTNEILHNVEDKV